MPNILKGGGGDVENKDAVGNFETGFTVLLRFNKMTRLKSYFDLKISDFCFPVILGDIGVVWVVLPFLF